MKFLRCMQNMGPVFCICWKLRSNCLRFASCCFRSRQIMPNWSIVWMKLLFSNWVAWNGFRIFQKKMSITASWINISKINTTCLQSTQNSGPSPGKTMVLARSSKLPKLFFKFSALKDFFWLWRSNILGQNFRLPIQGAPDTFGSESIVERTIPIFLLGC